MTDKRISTTPGYVGGLVTGHIAPAVQPKSADDALLIDNLFRATLSRDSDAIDRARMALRERMNELRAAAAGVETSVAPSFDNLFQLAHAWAQECYMKGLGKPCDIDGTRGRFAVALRLALPAHGVETSGGKSHG